MKARRAIERRVGMLGAGEIVRSHHVPLLLAAGVDVAWIADPSPSARRLAHQRFGVRALTLENAWSLLGQVDAVLLAAPVGLRAEHHERLASAGTPVYLEKPIARSTAELDDLIVKYGSTRVACGFQRRSLANLTLLRSLLADLPVGPVRVIELSEGSRTRATGTSTDFRDSLAAAGGGILTDLGCHGLDVLDQLVGLQDASVAAQALLVDEGVERDASIRLQTAGIDVSLEMSWLRDLNGHLRIVCADGVITSPAQMLGGVRIETETGTRLVFGEGSQNPAQGFWDAWRYVLQLPGGTTDYSLATARSVIRITEDVYRAAGLQ